MRCPPRGAAPRVPLESFFDPMTSSNALGVATFAGIRPSSSWLNLVERFFRELTDMNLRRGAFPSVPHHIASIETYLHLNNEHPKPLIWTATAESILTTVQRGRVSPQQVDSQL